MPPGPAERGERGADLFRLRGLHSVSIHLPQRITLPLLIQDREIIPVNFGEHDTV